MEKVKRTPASLKKMAETFGMEILHRGSDYDSAVITISDVNRPALQLVGFYDYFDDKRRDTLSGAHDRGRASAGVQPADELSVPGNDRGAEYGGAA